MLHFFSALTYSDVLYNIVTLNCILCDITVYPWPLFIILNQFYCCFLDLDESSGYGKGRPVDRLKDENIIIELKITNREIFVNNLIFCLLFFVPFNCLHMLHCFQSLLNILMFNSARAIGAGLNHSTHRHLEQRCVTLENKFDEEK